MKQEDFRRIEGQEENAGQRMRHSYRFHSETNSRARSFIRAASSLISIKTPTRFYYLCAASPFFGEEGEKKNNKEDKTRSTLLVKRV